MTKCFWTDVEVLAVLQSNEPYAREKSAWDQTIAKYQGELEDLALVLWGGEDFFVSDIIQRAWVSAADTIGEADGDLRHFLHSIVRKQSPDQAMRDEDMPEHAVAGGDQGGWNGPDIGDEDYPVRMKFLELEPGHEATVRRVPSRAKSRAR